MALDALAARSCAAARNGARSSPIPSAAEALGRGEAPAELAARLRAFLDRFGHRALSEGELRARTWREDPSPVLQALATLAAGTRAPGFAQQRGRRAARGGGGGDLRAPGRGARRASSRRALEAAREGVRARERTKSLAVALVDEGRRLARLAGARLAAEGRLAGAGRRLLPLASTSCAPLLGGRPPSLPELRRRRRRFEAAAGVPAPRLVDLRPGAAVRRGASRAGAARA